MNASLAERKRVHVAVLDALESQWTSATATTKVHR
jgi:hypothetical protein